MPKTESVAAFRKRFRADVIPKWYNPYLHVIWNFGILIGLCLFCLSQIKGPTVWELALVPLVFVLGNLKVFLVHKYLLHTPGVYKYGHRAHTVYHHHFFDKDSMVPEDFKDTYIVLFPPEVILSFALGFILPGYWILKSWLSLNAAALFCFMASFYFILYEVFHTAAHLPEGHWVRNLPWFSYMGEHHRIHHDKRVMSEVNFGIVYPLFDWLLGSLSMNRSVLQAGKVKLQHK